MSVFQVRSFLALCLLLTLMGCANVVPPNGGKRDITPPKLMSITPKDSMLNTKVKKIELYFDEFITVSNPLNEVQISPLVPVPLTVTGVKKKVTIIIPDTSLIDNTTYRFSFGKAIADLNEGNVFSGYNYTFSTGSYFDSLQLQGNVYAAATGMPDSTGKVLLYYASENDSAIVRKKPAYITRVNADGSFVFKGLPKRVFRMYALKDPNSNLVYDGTTEQIAFLDSTVTPGDTSLVPIVLKMFTEKADTTIKATVTTPAVVTPPLAPDKKKKGDEKREFTYSVNVDTSDVRKRSKDLTKNIEIMFNNRIGSILKEKIILLRDSNTLENFDIITDTAKKQMFTMKVDWQENTVYTLKLQKGFAKDTGGVGTIPSTYSFRTKRDDDYAKLNIHLPTAYWGNKFVLMVTTDKDTIHQKPVADTLVHLIKLNPATYTIRVIADKNENGIWDTGNLFDKLQPEDVFPYSGTISLKAGWENTIDFPLIKTSSR